MTFIAYLKPGERFRYDGRLWEKCPRSRFEGCFLGVSVGERRTEYRTFYAATEVERVEPNRQDTMR